MQIDRRSFLATAAAAAAVTTLPMPVLGRDFNEPQRYPDAAWKVLDDRFKKYMIGNAPLERIQVGSKWAEGPAWNAVGRYVVYSDIPNDRQLRWDEVTDQISLFRKPSNFSNGNTFDFQGRQISCEHSTARVVRYEWDGSVAVLAETFEGKQLNAPNDAVVHPEDGGIIFTDPGYGSFWWYEGNVRELELPDSVYHIDGGSGQLTKLTDEIFKPNGLCFSPDYKTLYVADTAPSHHPEPAQIMAWDVEENGRKLTNRRVFASAELDGKMGFHDGVRADVDGNIWASAGWAGEGYDGVHVYAPDGTRIGQILLPEICANLCFVGQHRNQLFMCASQSIYKIYTAAQGAHIT